MNTIRFGRISFETKLQHFSNQRSELERRRNALLEVVNFDTNINERLRGTKSEHLSKRGKWGFAGIQHDETWIAGKIGKETEDTDYIKDEEVKDYVQEERELAIVSFFVIDLRSSIIAYEYRRDVGKKAPYRIIRDVFNDYHSGTEEIAISPLVDKKEINRELDALSEITEVRFVNLHPTNPDSTNHSQNMDEFLEKGGISELTLEAEGEDETGIRLRETPLLDSSIGLAEEGYGSATIRGKDEYGEEKEISTEDKPIRSEVDEDLSDDSKKRSLMREIENALDKLEEQVN